MAPKLLQKKNYSFFFFTRKAPEIQSVKIFIAKKYILRSRKARRRRERTENYTSTCSCDVVCGRYYDIAKEYERRAEASAVHIFVRGERCSYERATALGRGGWSGKV